MLYLVGGTSRSGKSMVVKQILEQISLNYISLDVLMTTLIDAGNPFDIDYKADSDIIAKQLWPFTKNYLINISRHGEDYIIEGILLWPSLLKELDDTFEFRVCFLGYESLDSRIKLAQLKADKNQSWHNRLEFNDEEYLRQIDNIKIISQRLHDDAKACNYPYIESRESADDLFTSVTLSLFGKST